MLNRYRAQKLYPGFESLPHRQFLGVHSGHMGNTPTIQASIQIAGATVTRDAVLLGTAWGITIRYIRIMFRLVPTMRRGSATSLVQASARYASMDAARHGAADLLREDKVLKVMIVRSAIPGGYVEWIER